VSTALSGVYQVRKKRLDVLERRRRDVLHVADHRPVVGVAAREEQLVEPLVGAAVGLVVDPLAALVHHHLALHLQLLGGHRRQQPAHAVGLQPQAELEVRGGQRLVVVGAVVPGRAVGDAADLLDVAEVVVGADVLAALEEHVLEEVREAGAARRLVLRADVVPEVDGDERQRASGLRTTRRPLSRRCCSIASSGKRPSLRHVSALRGRAELRRRLKLEAPHETDDDALHAHAVRRHQDRLHVDVGGLQPHGRAFGVDALEVASSPIRATTISPATAWSRRRMTTRSPSWMPSSIIESPTTRST
jgi:hypothetical protein